MFGIFPNVQNPPLLRVFGGLEGVKGLLDNDASFILRGKTNKSWGQAISNYPPEV